MADVTDLKNRVRSSIKQNDNQEITGLVLQNTLLDIVDELNYNTESEEERAEDVEATLQQSISSETSRAQQAEAALAQSISSETTRAQQAEAALQQNIQQSVNAETTRAEQAEAALQQNINAENVRAEQAEAALQQSMEAEKSRLTPILTAMQQNISECVNNGYYDSSTKKIVLRHNTTLIAQIDATEFIKDGMVSNVQIINGNLVITFNTDAGQEPIIIPLTDIFNPNNYYNKSEIDQKLSLKQNTIQDLAAIRSGASAGSTAYQKPLYGIPKVDLSLQVQEILENAAQNYIEHEDVTSAESITVEPLTNPIYLSGPCDVYPGETFRFRCEVTNHNTYVIKDGNTPILLAQSDYGEVRWTNIYDTKVIVFGACESAEHECLVSVFTNGLSKQRLRADVQKAIEKAETAAQPDGYYETLGAGTANNLKSNITIDREIMFDKSGGLNDIDSGSANLSKVQGNTVPWNQLIKNGNFESNVNWAATSYGTASISSGVVTITANTTNKNAFEQNDGIDFVNGHKYYGRAVIQSSDSNVKKFNVAGVEFGNTSGTSKQSVSAIVNWNFGTNRFKAGFRDMATSDFQAFTVYSAIIIDLTIIYGAGNEPTSVAQFEADYQRWFGKPLDYEPYDTGSLRNVKMSAIKTTGFNQWDEEWENGSLSPQGEPSSGIMIRTKNYIKITPNFTYNFHYESLTPQNVIYMYFYDNNKKYIGIQYYYSGVDNLFNPPSSAAYMKFRTAGTQPQTTYNHDICINISDPSKNGTYEPYRENIASLPITTLTGKLNGLGESVTIFPDGMKSASGIRDEIIVENGITKAIKRIGQVDLGTLNWAYYDSEGASYPYFSALFTLTHFDNNNIKCHRYDTYIGALVNLREKTITRNFNEVNGLYVKDASYSDASTFKAAMQGIMLYYELRTPEVYVLDDNVLPLMYKVDELGTEQVLPECTEETPCCAPILSVNYAMNAVAQLRNMHINYISKASFDNFLNLINSTLVGVLGGTISVNPTQTNDAYTFAFNEVSNMVVFVSNGSQITNVIGNFPPYSYIDNGKAKFYLRHDSALIPLSVAYTGSITAVGVYSPYGSNDTYTVRFKGAYNTDIIGATVNVEQIN